MVQDSPKRINLDDMKNWFIVICLLSAANIVNGQKYYEVKSGMHLRDVFSFADMYQYPAFTAGRVQFKNGRSGGGKMNYNQFTGEIEFIEGKDTLVIGDKGSIKSISIGNDVFYFDVDAGFLLQSTTGKYAKIAKKEFIRQVDRKRESGYGTTSTAYASTVNNMGFLAGADGGVQTGSRARELVSTEDVVFKKQTDYYLGNEKGIFLKADKKNALKLYPEKKASLNAYLKENKIDFDNEESLMHLVGMIAQME